MVWSADDTDTPGVGDDEFEIFGQRIDAATGTERGVNDLRISDAGGTGDAGFIGPGRPAVAYNPTNNGYLVVWLANDPDTAGIVAGELEIFGQCLDAATGAEVGVNDFRISDVGGTGNVSTRVGFPIVAYNTTSNEYLVVWQADDTDTPGIVDGELEVFGQCLAAATGAEIGANDFRISDAGETGNPAFTATRPAVAYNPTNDEYLVVWQAEDTDTTGIVDGELEVFGQRLAAATGAEIGVNDFRISDVGGTGFPDFDAFFPDVAYNRTNNEYLVVWQADDTDTSGIVDDEFEIFGQRLVFAFVLHFAQFGNGSGLKSEIVLTNPHPTQTVTGEVTLLDVGGAVLDLRNNLSGTTGVDATKVMPQFSIPALGSVRIETDGLGPLSTGSVVVVATGAVGGVIRFEIAGTGVAGVGSGTPFKKAIVPVQRIGSINTGIATRNTSSVEQAVVNMTLRNLQGNGVAAGQAAVTLEPNARNSQFINEIFPGANTEDFQGTVTLESANSISALALELGDTGEFTTLPVTAVPTNGAAQVSITQAVAPFELSFAQFGNGGGLTSEIVIISPGASTGRCPCSTSPEFLWTCEAS